MAVSWQTQTHRRYWRASGSWAQRGQHMLCHWRGCTFPACLRGGGARHGPWDSHVFPYSQVQHYVEKPSTFVSEIINCGIYLFTPAIFQHIGEVFQRNQQELVL